MDNLYGLKEQHRIESFDLLFKETGLYEPLMSKDPQVSAQALCDLLTKFFDDGHSGNYTNSYMVKEDPERHWGPTRKMAIEFRDKYKNFRDKAYPNGVEPYEEVGNTAFITFDEFSYLDVDYYGGEKPEDHLEDTVGLILYAYQQVSRDNSPIENIVMDLSNNGGGMADAAAFVLGAFLREGSISMMNPTTGALVSETVNVDLNLDRKFDEKDSFENFNLFCITSPNSFSCGNLVPSVFKSTFKVTLLGQQSAGGACAVHDMSSADGAFFKMSGCRRLAYMKNGSFYDIDQGVEPDYIISNPALFYDRKYIANFCDQVMGK